MYLRSAPWNTNTFELTNPAYLGHLQLNWEKNWVSQIRDLSQKPWETLNYLIANSTVTSVKCQSPFHSSCGRSSWVRYQKRSGVIQGGGDKSVTQAGFPFSSLYSQNSPMLKSLLSRAILLNSLLKFLMLLCWPNPQSAQMCFCTWVKAHMYILAKT